MDERTEGRRSAKRMGWRGGVLATLLVGSLALGACGGDDGEQSTQGGQAAGGGASAVDAAQERLAVIADADGEFGEPPAESPAPAQDKTVWLVSFGQVVPAIATVIAAMEDAGNDLGWKTKVWDGKLDPNQQLAGVRAGINAKADGIVVYGADCPTILPGLRDADKAGIPVIAVEAWDCDQLKEGGPKMFDHQVHYEQGSLGEYLDALGRYQADWAITYGDGATKVLSMRQTDAVTLTKLADAFEDQIRSECPDCEIVDTVEFTSAEYGNKLQQKTQQALLQNPDTDVVSATADVDISQGIGAGIRASQNKPPAIGWECDPSTKEFRDSGIQGVCFDLVSPWEGYAAMDAMNRLFAGEEPAEKTGIGIRLIDEDTNSEGHVDQKGPVDFVSLYREAWGTE